MLSPLSISRKDLPQLNHCQQLNTVVFPLSLPQQPRLSVTSVPESSYSGDLIQMGSSSIYPFEYSSFHFAQQCPQGSFIFSSICPFIVRLNVALPPAIMNKAAVNKSLQGPVFSSLGCVPVCNSKFVSLSSTAVPFCVPCSSMQGFQFGHILVNTRFWFVISQKSSQQPLMKRNCILGLMYVQLSISTTGPWECGGRWQL